MCDNVDINGYLKARWMEFFIITNSLKSVSGKLAKLTCMVISVYTTVEATKPIRENWIDCFFIRFLKITSVESFNPVNSKTVTSIIEIKRPIEIFTSLELA